MQHNVLYMLSTGSTVVKHGQSGQHLEPHVLKSSLNHHIALILASKIFYDELVILKIPKFF